MMEIIRMNESHVSQIAALEKLCFSDAWSENSIRSELSNKLSLWLVAVDGDRVAGYIGSQTVLGWADMMNLCVSPDYRRQGIGEKLTLELERQLREEKVECLTLEVRVSNAPAIALYEKLGFKQVGKRPRYYEKPREDALILRKEFMK
jgi:ribosomal-protein-alanine N-acetyltransferase